MPKISTYSLDTTITDNDSLLGVNAADGTTKRYSMSGIKAALLEGADITAVIAGTGLSGGATSGAATLTIDSTVVTLTGTQTLTNKTLTTPVISTISNSGTITLPTSSDTLVGRATTDTLTNKTLTSPSIATPTWTATESAIANGDYLLFLDASASSETKKDALADIATLFAGTGLTASNSVIGIDASQTQITGVGTITTGTWQASLVGIDYGGTGLSGETDGYIVIADGSGSATHLDVGSSTGITILGTIATGVWQGTAIDTAYIDTTLTSQTSILNSSLVVGYGSSHANIDFSTDNSIIFDIDGTSQIQLDDGVLKPTTDSDVDLGTSSLYFKDSYIDTVTTTGNVTVGGNLSITGDLTVSGDTTTVNTATLSVEDPLIIVGSGNNSSDAVDLGLYGLYDTSGSQDLYAGLFRDASDSGKWKLFKSLQAAPTTTVNTSGTGYAVDTLVANIEGNVTGNVTGNTSGTAATVTTAAQTNITSLGTLTGLDVNGAVTINDNLSLDGSNKELRFYEAANYVGFEAPALSADQIWVLPSADGSSGTALKTDGSGNLSWGTAGGDVFKTISVSGQSDVVADGVADTLTLVAGTGTTITTNASTDTITINAGANTVEVDEYTGNGSTTAYTLSTTCTSENNLLVYMDGVFQHHNTYAVSGTTLTFDTNVPNGSKVEAYHMISVSNSDMVQAAVAGTLMDVSGATGSVTFNVDLTEAGEATIANGDYILFLDGGATGTHAKEAIADVATLFAGTGLTASSSVINIDAAQTGITSLLATDIKIGEDDQTKIDFETADTINFYAGNEKQLILTDGALTPGTNAIVDLGTDALEFKDAYFDGTVEADAITIGGTALNTVIAGVTVSNATLAATATVTDSTANTDFPVVFHNESNGLLDDTAAFEYNPSTGTLIVANLDIGTDVDVDGTLEADAITVGGTNIVSGSLITTLGTISAGVWNGTVIASAYLDSDTAHLSGTQTFSGAKTFSADVAFSGDTATFSSANSTDPLVVIKNTTNDANGSRLHFIKDKGAAGADGDDIGTIEFISDDAGQAQTSFAKIVAEVSEADNTDEAGKLSFYVAESDGTTTALTAGLVLEGEHATDGEVDVTIGAGAASTTSIAGNVYAAGGKFGIDTGDYMQFTANTQTDFYVNGNNEMRLEADGDLHVDGDVVGYSTTIGSDEKIKTNISPIEGAIDKLKQINGVTFNYKRNNKPSGGVIAQNIEKVMPSLVGEQETLDGKDTFKTVDYNGIIGLLIESVKELEERLNRCECNKN